MCSLCPYLALYNDGKMFHGSLPQTTGYPSILVVNDQNLYTVCVVVCGQTCVLGWGPNEATLPPPLATSANLYFLKGMTLNC